MKDKRNALTQATGITADVVMELGAYSNAQRMRKVQTGLTSAARELRAFSQHSSLLGRLGEKLSPEQRELLSNAAALLDSVNYNVAHAKERKVRDEKALAKKRQLWEREAEQLDKKHFSLPVETVAEQLQVLELHLVAHELLGHLYYMKDHSGLRKMMQEEPPRWFNLTLGKWRQREVSSLLADIRYSIRSYLSSRLDMTPTQRLEGFLRTVETRRAEILAKPQSVESLRVWSEALKSAAFITSVMPSVGPTA